MPAPGNPLADFPADSFAILAFCETCGRQSRIDRTRVPANVTVEELRGRLRVQAARAEATAHEAMVRAQAAEERAHRAERQAQDAAAEAATPKLNAQTGQWCRTLGGSIVCN